MPIILGLDIGDRRVGIAISDINGKIAKPYAVFNRANYLAEKQVIELINKLHIQDIVVGLPLDEHNLEGSESEKIKNFCRRLQKRLKININYIDEYGSSQEAKERLGISNNPNRKQRKTGEIDSIAASIILQKYLNQGNAYK